MNDVVILYEDQYLQVLYRDRNSNSLIITFGNMLNRADSIRMYADKVADKLNLSILGFMPKGAYWYPSSSMMASYCFLSEILESYNIRIGYGGSMGGYGVIKYSKLLNLTKVIALDPQYSIFHEDITDDTYNKYYNENIHRNMKIVSEDYLETCIYYVAYDPYYLADLSHVNSIRECIRINEIKVNFSYHSTESIFASSNFLYYLFFQDFDEREILKKIRMLKRNNGFHLNHLLKKIYLTNKERFFYLMKCSNLDFSQIDDTIKSEAVRYMINNDINSYHLYEKMGLKMQSVEYYLEGVHGGILYFNSLISKFEVYKNKESIRINFLHPIKRKNGHLVVSYLSNDYYIATDGMNCHLISLDYNIADLNLSLFEQKFNKQGVYIFSDFGFVTPLPNGGVKITTKDLNRWEFFKIYRCGSTLRLNIDSEK